MTDTFMTMIRQNVRRGMLAAVACLFMLAPRLAAAAQEVVNVQFDGAAGIVDLQLLRDGNKIVSAFAVETQRNTPWLAKTDQLTVAVDGRITGTITFTQTPDLLALQGLRRVNKDAKAPPVLTEEVSLDGQMGVSGETFLNQFLEVVSRPIVVQQQQGIRIRLLCFPERAFDQLDPSQFQRQSRDPVVIGLQYRRRMPVRRLIDHIPRIDQPPERPHIPPDAAPLPSRDRVRIIREPFRRHLSPHERVSLDADAVLDQPPGLTGPMRFGGLVFSLLRLVHSPVEGQRGEVHKIDKPLLVPALRF